MQPRNFKRAPLCGVILLAAALLSGAPALAQDYAGTQELFKLGVGARAIALGSAVVAMPLDPSTVYWNPGGLDFLERRSIMAFYTTLIADAKYHFIGAAYPFLGLGTFGAGWVHLDGGEFERRDVSSASDGMSTYGEDVFLVSFAKQVRYGFSLGASAKFRRQALVNTAQGYTGDFGLLYRPEMEGIWQDFSVGFSIQNLIPLRLRLENETETIPSIMRGGIAKSLRFGPRADVANFFLAVEKGQGDSPSFGFGSEYVYQNLAMLRLGYNGQQLSFGGGVSYQVFQIDYAYGKYGRDDAGFVDAQHRLSITMHFGKTKTQMQEEEQAKLIRQIEAETRKQALLIRRRDFEEQMTAGKAYFDQKDYFNALIRFQQARDLVAGAYESFENTEKADVNVWVDRAKSKMEEEELAEKVKLTQEAQESAVQAQSRAFVEEQHRKGMQFLQAGKYNEAIAEWERGLERDPSNAKLKDLITKTQGEQRSRTAELKRQAEAQVSRGQIVEAIDSYNRLMNAGTVTTAEVAEYQAKIKNLQRQLNVEQLFRNGYNEYLNKNYCAAKGFFTQALEVEPNNSALRQYYNDADARCNARLTPLPESIRKRFVEATSLIESGNYEAALRILEDIQRHDRYNQRILDAIDLARERIKNKKPK